MGKPVAHGGAMGHKGRIAHPEGVDMPRTVLPDGRISEAQPTEQGERFPQGHVPAITCVHRDPVPLIGAMAERVLGGDDGGPDVPAEEKSFHELHHRRSTIHVGLAGREGRCTEEHMRHFGGEGAYIRTRDERLDRPDNGLVPAGTDAALRGAA